MAAINTARIARQLEEGLNASFGDSYNQYPDQWRAIYQVLTSRKWREEELALSGLGLARFKEEGAPTQFDEMGERWTAIYRHRTVTHGFEITLEAIEDNLYESTSARGARAMARSFKQTKEIEAARPFNDGFTTAFATGDAAPLFSTAHPTTAGNQANRPTNNFQLNEAAVEEIQFMTQMMRDDRGLLINASPTTLIVPTRLQYIAKRVLYTDKMPGTAENDINPIANSMKIAVHRYLVSDTAFFAKTDVPDGFKHFKRVALKTGMQGDFTTDITRYKGRERYSFGVSDWRGGWGCQGA